MDRRSLIKNAGIAGVLSAGIAPAVHAQAAVRWRLASSFPKSLPTIFGSAEKFSETVKALSGGKFEVSVHAAGDLMPPFGVVDALQNSTVEMAQTASYYFTGKDPIFAFGCAVPFGLTARHMDAWMEHGNGRKLMDEFYGKFNIVSMSSGNTGTQMGGWYRKEIKTVADLKGLKMRIGGFAGKVLTRMGGVPQNIPGGEIYQALEKGTIDATEWIGPYDDEKLGFQKVAKNYYYPGWWEGGLQLDLYINRKAYEALSSVNKAMRARDINPFPNAPGDDGNVRQAGRAVKSGGRASRLGPSLAAGTGRRHAPVPTLRLRPEEPRHARRRATQGLAQQPVSVPAHAGGAGTAR